MRWDLKEAAAWYRRQGAPGDQNALKHFLTEAQEAHGGAIPAYLLAEAARELGTKESFLTAIVRRFPSLHLQDVHILELCGGPNCARSRSLIQAAESYRGRVEIRFVPCMRQCGQGPNLRYDGKLFSGATAELLKELIGD